MVGAGVCSTTILFLLAVAVTASCALDELTAAVQAIDHTAGTEETSDLLPVHHNGGDKGAAVNKAEAGGHRDGGASADVAASLQSREEDGKMVVGPDWRKAKKMDDDNDDDDKGDSDHDHDSDHDSDSDHHHDHDSDSDHDHDSDHDSESDSDHDSDDDHDDDDDDHSKHENKKHGPSGRKVNPGGKHDDKLPNVVEIKL